MQQMWKRTDILKEETMSEWTARPAPQRRWAHMRPFFEGAVAKNDAYIKAGGKRNQFAAANAIKEATEKAEKEAADREQRMREQHALAVAEIKADFEAKIGKLTEAMLQLTDKLERAQRRRRAADSDEESSDDEEPAPPPRKKKKTGRCAWCGGRGRRGGAADTPPPPAAPAAPAAPAPAPPGFNNVFVEGAPFRPGMAFDPLWTAATRSAYKKAREEFMATGTQEAIKEKIRGIKAMIAGGTKVGSDLKNIKESLARWEAKVQ